MCQKHCQAILHRVEKEQGDKKTIIIITTTFIITIIIIIIIIEVQVVTYITYKKNKTTRRPVCQIERGPIQPGGQVLHYCIK